MSINNVKKVGSQIKWEPWMIEELEKCKNDFFYFCKYVKIKHPDKGRISYEPRWYQKEFLNKILNNRHFIGLLSRQVGKAQDLDSIVWDDNGKKRFGDLKIGDKIYDDNGDLTTVTNIYPQGIRDIYEIEFFDGTKVRCCDEHLWTVEKWKKEKTVTLSEIREKYLDKRGDSIYYVKMNEPVKYPKQKLPLDPYLIGLIIGDGSIRNDRLNITTEDKEIVEYLYSMENEEICIKKDSYHNNVYKMVKKTNKHKIINELKELNLMDNLSIDKFIPKKYLYSSIEQRISLLQGLMDTNGTASNNQPSYSTSSEQLSENFRELCHSLGIRTKISKKLKGKLSYNIRLYLKNDYQYNIFRLKRKQSQIKNKKFDWGKKRGIVNIKWVGKKEAQCIEVDNDSNLYLTDNYIPTHNTVSVSVYILWYSVFRSEKTIGIVSNKESSAKKILREIKKMYESIPDFLKPGVKIYNKTSIEFENNTIIQVSATTEDPFRGETLNCVTDDTKICICNDYNSIFWTSIKKLNSSKNNINNIKGEFIMNWSDEKKKYYTVYQITNKINGKIYIGFHSTNDLDDGYMGSGKIIKIAIEKYGIENFSKKYIEIFDNKEDAEKLEKELVNEDFVKRKDNYNLSLGGNVCILYGESNGFYGKTHTQETKEKIKQGLLKKFGIKRKHPKEVIEKIKITSRKTWNDPEMKRKCSKRSSGRKHSEETKKKIGQKHKNKIVSEESKKKMSDAAKEKFKNYTKEEYGIWYNKTFSKENCKKRSEKMKGRKIPIDQVNKVNKNPEKIRKTAEKHRGMKRSEESKKKMSESAKNRPSNNKGKIYCHNPETLIGGWFYSIPDGWKKGYVKK